jgi:hypothetical protein
VVPPPATASALALQECGVVQRLLLELSVSGRLLAVMTVAEWTRGLRCMPLGCVDGRLQRTPSLLNDLSLLYFQATGQLRTSSLLMIEPVC